jgi:hypothetical protein
MKRLKSLVVLKIILTLFCLTNFNSESVQAQDFGLTSLGTINRVTKQRKINNVPKRSIAPRQAVRVVIKEKYITTETTKQVKPTGLSVTVLPDTDIFLESIDTGIKVEKKGKAKDESITFEPLRPGKYRLSASLEGYEPVETDVTILREKTTVIPIKLKQETHDFSIKANVSEGEVRFAPVTVLGENPDGTLNVKEKGGFCMVPIKNGKATINEMREGAYIIDVRAEEVEYQAETAVIKIPEDIPVSKNPNESALFPVNLDNTLSTGVFTLENAWTLTNKDWKIDVKGLKANGVGIGLPKDKGFRYYKDFEMVSTVRLLNNTSVGFVVRAVDNDNYYLIELTGESHKDPYLVRGWIVKNGKPAEEVLKLPIKFFLGEAIVQQKYFDVIIKAKGNTFEIFAVNTKGEQRPLGTAIFNNNNFPIGAVGIGALENSSFEVGRFIVCNEACKTS